MERDCLEDLGIDGMILKVVLERNPVRRARTGLIWLRTGKDCGLLLGPVMQLTVPLHAGDLFINPRTC